MKMNRENVDVLCEKVINAIKKDRAFNKESLLKFLKKKKYKEPYEEFIVNLIPIAAEQGKQEHIQQFLIHHCFEDMEKYIARTDKEIFPSALSSFCLLAAGITDLGYSIIVPFVEKNWLQHLYYDAQMGDNILIVGETGTGKQAMARAIHLMSERRKLPFEEINCAAIPENLLESELFGHAKGAFTGATGKKTGKLVQAGKGTIFLDELGKMPLHLQAKILKVMDVKFITPIGSTKRIQIEGRFIGAAQPDDIKNGKIMPDLLYRFGNPDFIHMPPLRDRMPKNPYLVIDSSLHKAKQRLQISDEITFDDQLVAVLQNYNYPGNYRELENILRYGIKNMMIADRKKLLPEDVMQVMKDSSSGEMSINAKDIQLKDIIEYANNVRKKIIEQKIRDIIENGKSLAGALKKEGLSDLEYQNFYKKITKSTGIKLRELKNIPAGIPDSGSSG